MFVTSAAYEGAPNDAAAADAFCSSTAAERGFSGSYVAWLADGGVSAYDRIDDAGPWYTTRGDLAFGSKQAIVAGPETPILDESGAQAAIPEGEWSAAYSDDDGRPLICFEQ